jgi:hypothetical protein
MDEARESPKSSRIRAARSSARTSIATRASFSGAASTQDRVRFAARRHSMARLQSYDVLLRGSHAARASVTHGAYAGRTRHGRASHAVLTRVARGTSERRTRCLPGSHAAPASVARGAHAISFVAHSCERTRFACDRGAPHKSQSRALDATRSAHAASNATRVLAQSGELVPPRSLKCRIHDGEPSIFTLQVRHAWPALGARMGSYATSSAPVCERVALAMPHTGDAMSAHQSLHATYLPARGDS